MGVVGSSSPPGNRRHVAFLLNKERRSSDRGPSGLEGSRSGAATGLHLVAVQAGKVRGLA